MSVESAKAFIERMKTDEAFNKKINMESAADARMALAQSEGYHFTVEDISVCRGELTDDELNSIAAGYHQAGCHFSNGWFG